jgi:uncharacterized membrane protein (UPF0127 family)
MFSLVENPPQVRHIGRVKLKFIPVLLLVVVLGAGCTKPEAPVAPAQSPTDNTPKQAQPKLRTMKLYIGREILEAELALTPKEIQTGMMFRTNIQETDAMLFNLQIPQRAAFWMRNCPESISVAYLTSDGAIQDILRLEKNDTNSVYSSRNDIVFALETKEGWFDRHNIKPGTVVASEKGSLAEVFLRDR